MTDPALETIGETAAKTGKLPKTKRHILLRLLGISWWGWIKLALLCVLVGFFVMASEFDPASPDVNVMGAMQRFLQSVAGLAGWAARNFWKPALAGATFVLPLWLVWRLASLPFRK
ncbi:MAG: hypothetical protein K0U61_11575 [Alphaproteobacteria bacterium]|nr:hypothetical protein [Henriciella sp.]MBO6694344.1 hypothetical protein [Henriciella sp.]MCH9752844.1 hypothetical protein [Alphaproteobacteria bacterium]